MKGRTGSSAPCLLPLHRALITASAAHRQPAQLCAAGAPTAAHAPQLPCPASHWSEGATSTDAQPVSAQPGRARPAVARRRRRRQVDRAVGRTSRHPPACSPCPQSPWGASFLSDHQAGSTSSSAAGGRQRRRRCGSSWRTPPPAAAGWWACSTTAPLWPPSWASSSPSPPRCSPTTTRSASGTSRASSAAAACPPATPRWCGGRGRGRSASGRVLSTRAGCRFVALVSMRLLAATFILLHWLVLLLLPSMPRQHRLLLPTSSPPLRCAPQVMGLTTAIGVLQGTNSPMFAIALVFSLIVSAAAAANH